MFWSHFIVVYNKEIVNQRYGVYFYYKTKKGFIKAIVTPKLLEGLYCEAYRDNVKLATKG